MFSPTIDKKYELVTNERGQISFDISEVAALITDGTSLNVRFESAKFKQASNTFTIPSSFFSDLKAYYASICPPSLSTKLTFDDASSWRPNKMIDGAEKSYLIATIENSGEGKALDVKLKIDNNNPDVSLNQDINIGTIEPGKKMEKRIQLSAAMDISDGKATFTAYTKEQRGYDAKPFQLNINVRHLDKPVLSYSSFKLNDGTTGVAKGNNNNIAESDETVEIAAFVKNIGVGPAMKTTLKLTSATPGIQIHKDIIDLGTISPGATKQGTVVLYIPRTFAKKEIRLNFSAQDMLDASIVNKEYVLPVKTRFPLLTFDNRILSSDGVQVNQISNGADYLLEIKPRNDGTITAKNVNISVAGTPGINLKESYRSTPQIAAGAAAGVMVFPFSLPRNFVAPEVNFNVRLSQDDFDPISTKIPIIFKPRKPRLIVQTTFTNSRGEPTISQGDYAELNLFLQNTGDMDAENVVANWDLNNQGIDLPNPSKNFGRIPCGMSQAYKFRFYVKNSAQPGIISSKFHISQADGFAGFDKSLSFEIAEAGAIVMTVTGQQIPGKELSQTGLPSGRTNEPPRVKVLPLRVNEANQTFDPQIKVKITITDDKPLLGREPEIFVNGKIQSKEKLLRGIDLKERSQSVGDKKLVLVRNVQLNEGLNRIEVRFMDSDNEPDTDYSNVELVTTRTDVYALIVGISEYAASQTKIERLRYAHRDAQKFADFLQSPAGGNVPPKNIKMLTNAEAKRGNILKALNEILGRAQKNDVVYLYFAMHAVPDISGQPLFFLAYDSDPDDLWSTAIDQNQLQGKLRHSVRSNKVVFIADACHSGTLGSQEIGQRANRANLTNRLLSEMSKARNGLALFMAADASQTSQESEKWNGGVFTHYLLMGMKGAADENKNGFVSLAELSRYVPRAVAEATNGQQTPVIGGNYDGNMAVGIVK